MSDKKFYVNLDGLGVAQLKGMRIQNVADADAQATLETSGNNGATLGSENIGLVIYRVDLSRQAIWNGSEFAFQDTAIEGDVIFKGMLDASLPIDDAGQPQVIEPVSGHQYVVSVAGTFDAGASGVTLVGQQVLQAGSHILFTSDTEAYVIQHNGVTATETVEGSVRLATEQEVLDGDSGNAAAAVTAETLAAKLAAYPVSFTTTLDLTGLGTADNVQHDLGLASPDGFVINVMRGGSQVSVDVDSVDANNITLTSLVPLTGVTVTISGVKA